MVQLGLIIVFLTGLFTPFARQVQTECSIPTDNPAPAFTWELNQEVSAPALAEQMVTYLNATHSSENLLTALTHDLTGRDLSVTVLNSDFTGDSVEDIAVQLVIDTNGAFYDYALSLFTCQAGVYQQLDTFSESLWMAYPEDTPPARLELAIDLNNNQRRDILVRREVLGGQKIFTELLLFEWDGQHWAKTLAIGPSYEGYGEVHLGNRDDDPLTLELTVETVFFYESGTALAFIEYNYYRPIALDYVWNGEEYYLECSYFTDEALSTLQILHTAEALRACGRYDEAAQGYQKLMAPVEEEIALTPWTNTYYPPPLEFPAGMDEDEQYQRAAEVESAYYVSFAAYRLLQLALLTPETAPETATYLLEVLLEGYHPGDQGYVYKAMGQALWENYQTTGDLQQACDAAEAAFNATYTNGDDPGITYAIMTYQADGTPLYMPFYYAGNGFSYGANPDNFFNVPPEIAPMVSTPICLE